MRDALMLRLLAALLRQGCTHRIEERIDRVILVGRIGRLLDLVHRRVAQFSTTLLR